MKFELEEYHRGVTNEELIAELRRIASELGKNSVSLTENRKRGKYSASTYSQRFGSWAKATEMAGLEKAHIGTTAYSDEELIADLQNVATELNNSSVTREEYDERGKYESSTFVRRFGKWYKVLERAGLKADYVPMNVPEEELFKNLEEIWIQLGRQPRSNEIKTPLSKYHLNRYKRRFGTWRNALEKFIAYINNEELISSEVAIQNVQDDPSSIQKQNEAITESTTEKNSVSQETTKSIRSERPFTHKTKREVNLRLRFFVMRRDNFKCTACGRSPAVDSTIILHVDHITAWANRGETVIENLQTLCSKCNIGKSDLE